MNKLKKVFNIGDCTIDELKNILAFYEKRASVDCDIDIEYYINRLFLYCYKPTKLIKEYPQNNYCLLAATDITSKLARGSKNYDQETKNMILLYLDKIYNYYFKTYHSRDKLLINNVLTFSLIDRLITLEEFANKDFMKNLIKTTDEMFNAESTGLELKDQSFNNNIELIATNPYALAVLDLFGIDIPRNDKVLDIFKENLIKTESEYLTKRKIKEPYRK